MSNIGLVRATIFDNVLVNAAGEVESSALSLQHVAIVESLVLRAASATGTADVKLEYITSPDNINYEAYADLSDIISSTLTGKANNPEGFNPFYMPSAPMNGWIKFKVTGVNANPTDTLVTCYAWLREGER